MVATDARQQTTGYAHPEVLVSTEWVAEHLDDPQVRIVESDEDILLYDFGHVPGAVKLDWHTDLQDPVARDFVDKDGFEALMRRAGIANETTVVFYGDRNNWYATYTFWLFKLYGHEDCRVMDGGRAKWEAEGRPMTREMPSFPPTAYTAQEADLSIRAFRDDVLAVVRAGDPKLVDVRSPQEYTGEVIHMVNYPQEGRSAAATSSAPATSLGQGGQRGRHLQAGRRAARPLRGGGDHPGRADDRLLPDRRALQPHLVRPQVPARYPDVRNYDGSWTEWGSMVGVPIAKGPQPFGEGAVGHSPGMEPPSSNQEATISSALRCVTRVDRHAL
jgi:thiosulfate/3-mercaptopyruvate sulfurtransferase